MVTAHLTPKETAEVPERSRLNRVVSRLRMSMTVLGTLAVVGLEFGLLHIVYHHADAGRQAAVVTARLSGRAAVATPSESAALVVSVQTGLRSVHITGTHVDAVLQTTAALRRTPDERTLTQLRQAIVGLESTLADNNRRSGIEADLIYVLLLVIASLGWMTWFRRLVARHRRLQQDVTEAQSTARGEQRLAAMVRNSADLVILCDVSGGITFATPSAHPVLGVDANALIGRSFLDFVDPDERETFLVALSTLRPEEDREVSVRMHHSDGRVLNLEGTVTDLSADPTVAALLITVRDVTTRVDLETQLRRQAFYDSLTQLANRQLFSDRLAHALARRSPGDRQVAVLFCDLDEFKNINDSLGHRVGDLVLTEVAQRAVSVTSAGDTVARLGGDEFAILLEEADLQSATQVAEAMLRILSRPIEVDGHILNVRASVGLALSSAEVTTGDEILRNADVAMYLAKERGKGTIAAYDGDLHSIQLDRITLHAELETALSRNELTVHYQPIVELNKRTIVGFEALVRWEHPTRGLLGPDTFIPIAEKTGLIHLLGRVVLRSACRAAVEFTRSSGRMIAMSVNVAAQQLGRADFVAEVKDALLESGLPGSQLTIEITETVLLTDVTVIVGRLAELRGLGVRIAIDDFGTGYSSLAYLRDLPLDVIKVDKAFIDRAAINPGDAALAEAIIGMSRSMNLVTVAEGVEQEDQATWLTRSHCTFGQGYLWSRPVPGDEAAALIGPGPLFDPNVVRPDQVDGVAAQATGAKVPA